MSLEDQSVICFAPDPWDSMWRNRHQIMSRLSRKNKVLYVEPETYCIRDGIRQAVKSVRGGTRDERLISVNDRLWIYKHPWWGVNSHWPVLKQVGFRLRIWAIQRVIKRLDIKSPILWVVDPRFENMARHIKKSLLCYHVVDNYSAAPYYSDKIRSDLEKAERKLLLTADLVIVTAPFLMEEKSRYNNNVHLVKNAVDYEQFSALKHLKRKPDDMLNMPGPIIGYIGAVNEKLDYELLNTVVRRKPEWSFVFVGVYPKTPGSPASRFAEDHPPNVFLLGRRDVKDIPKYIQACSICILPYRRDEYTRAIDSLKLYEYFACEKPVVATDIPVIREHSDALYIAVDSQDFVQKIEVAMASQEPKKRLLQRSIAMQNTWDMRVEQLSSIIEAKLHGC
ncbi:MAG: glycosyltransferase family 1 protein [Nitrospiraceae bacterium]|nr:MAG: glycosyltransferase family 1 protein [Nitrospiraceae bacterium]